MENKIYIFTQELTVIDVEQHLRFYDYCCTAELVNQLVKALEGAIEIIVKFLDMVQHSNSAHPKDEDNARQCYTVLDQKQFTLQKEVLVSNLYILIFIHIISYFGT